MEAIAGYASSSSSACEERPSQPSGACTDDCTDSSHTSLTEHESLPPSPPRDAPDGGTADDPSGPGGIGDGAPDEAGDDGRRRKRLRRRAPDALAGYGVGREVSVDYGARGGALFRRTQPHWEGRWAGHIYLPFPAEETLGLANGEDSPTARRHGPPADNSDSSSEEGSSESEDERCEQSMLFIPTARKLVDHWACMLRGQCNGSLSYERLVIVPHFGTRDGPSLHVSLARPVFLPSSSVDPFMEDVQRSLRTVLTRQQDPRVRWSKPRVLQLQPRNAVLLTNDTGTRSFLAMPVSDQSSRWVKQTLLPPIDAAMLKFGQQTYYTSNSGPAGGGATPERSTSEYGTGCVLHVSVASVSGDVVAGSQGVELPGAEPGNKAPLFPGEGCGGRATAEDRSSLPAVIPVQVDRVTVDFGGGKKFALDL